MYLARNLMFHKVDHYTFTESAIGEERIPVLVRKNIKCNIGPTGGGIVDMYKQREEQPTACIYTFDKDAFNAITVRDQIVSQGSTYKVLGCDDLDNLGQVFRIDVKQDVD